MEKQLDGKKVDYLRQLLGQSFGHLDELRMNLQIGPLKVLLHYRSSPASRSKGFLFNHLNSFLTEELDFQADITIYYVAIPGDTVKQGIWEDPRYDWRVYPSSEPLRINIIQRDFIADSNVELTHLSVFGPEVTDDCMDSIDNLLTIVLSKNFPLNDAIIVHASTVIINNEAYVFYGKSGAGKSTLAQLSIDKLGLNILGSDQIYLQLTAGKLYAVSSPVTIAEFPRGHPHVIKGKYPVRALVHLWQNGGWGGRRLSKTESLMEVFKETFYFKEFSAPRLILDLMIAVLALESVETLEMCYPFGESYLDHLFTMIGKVDEFERKSQSKEKEAVLEA